ncbi:hypothetical protein NDS46_30960 (plasmid) [Paenibacillus thiaminolyticus]|uniref:hypothetical protein n=1 Tax=Paenibacillus thiaminolyticus TaxID=49283 RepID=UPI00232ED7CD|nr:hypothetical protein [Paenibacillus thiaminolyticus]WCF11381.1 hypothetical protein NDS46_30960 [Paenibacillus thiaminolyticus]
MLKRKKKYEGMSFEKLAHIINGYLLEEGLILNLTGYRNILQRYFRVQDNHLSDIYEVMIDCNLWFNYLADIQSLVSLKKEEWTLEAEYLYATEILAAPSESLENRIQAAKERAKHYSIFEKHIESQKKFFMKASHACQVLFQNGLASMRRS